MDETPGRLRWLRIPAAMAAIGLLVAACGNQGGGPTTGNMASNDKQILRINTNTEPNSFDPGQETYDYEISTIGHQVFQPLLQPTKDLKDVTGAAASGYDVSSDGLTYTFHLRQNAKWSDGQPVKASDFVYGWQRVLDPTLAAGYADPFFDGTVKGGENYSKVDVKDKAAVQSYIQALGLAAPDDHTVKVTEAVSRAIDRNALVNDVAKGFYVARQTFIPLGMTGYKPSLGSAQDYDAAKAKAALQASGVPVAAYDKVKLLTRNTTTNKQLNEFIVNQINTNLGVHWTLDVIDSKTVTTNIRKGNFQIYGPDGWGADYPDQQDWYDIFTTGGCHGTNWGCWNNKDYDSLVQKADASRNESERNSMYDQAQQMLVNQYVVSFLYNRPAPVLVKPYVQGLTILPIDSAIYLPGETYSTTVYIANH